MRPFKLWLAMRRKMAFQTCCLEHDRALPTTSANTRLVGVNTGCASGECWLLPARGPCLSCQSSVHVMLPIRACACANSSGMGAARAVIPLSHATDSHRLPEARRSQMPWQ